MMSSGASAVSVASTIALSIDHQLHSATESESRVFQIQSRVHSLPALRTIITAPAPPQVQHPQTISTKMTSDRLRSRISLSGKGVRSPSLPSSPRSRLNPTFTTSPAPPQLATPALHSASSSSIVTRMTPSRAPRPSRDRAGTQSRSSSLPIALRIHNSHPNRSSPSSGRSTPRPRGKRSVKHLTCFWWQQKGHCRFSEEDCLYAHHDTGMYTQPPRQLHPGGPAMAGRNLDRNIQKLHSKRSSASLSSLNVSRPATPRAVSFDSPIQTLIKSDLSTTRDRHILRDLVEQGSKETAVLISTIDSLQNENKVLKQQSEGFTHLLQNVERERDMLRHALEEAYAQSQQRRPTYNPFGVVGGEVRNQEPGPSPAQIQNENHELKNILRNYGMSF